MVYDVGRHRKHDYRSYFPSQTFRSIDRDPKAGADLLLDLESPGQTSLDRTADAILCNGVTEVCGNPFQLARGVFALVKPGGLALWGIMSVAYPIYETDFTRFTPDGAVHLVESAGFRNTTLEIIRRGKDPSYCFITCEKP